jgi:hypothetical protein
MRTEVQVAAASVQGYSVAYLFGDDGKSEVMEFMTEMSTQQPKDYKKTIALFSLAAQIGTIKNPEKFKQVDGAIWEFKGHQVRILWFRHPQSSKLLVCASAERKKRNDLSPGTIKRAHDRLTEFQAHLGK